MNMENNNLKGKIFKISRFCADDGPGIRTAVFLKGCPLQCLWCHNPEGLNKEPQLMFERDKCTFCGKCKEVCPKHCHIINGNRHLVSYNNCDACSKCVIVCPYNALSVSGTITDAQSIVSYALKDITYYNISGGGLTLTGGEVLFQPKFAENILKLSKENGLHTCIETSGAGKESDLEQIAQYTDLFLFDFKIFDSIKLKKFCGMDYELFIKNFNVLNCLNKSVILRCPIIGSVNDNVEHMRKIAIIANSYKNVISAEILPYHELGRLKAEQLGFSQKKFYPPDKDKLKELLQIATKLSEKPILLKDQS